jgi:hypothetical protein
MNAGVRGEAKIFGNSPASVFMDSRLRGNDVVIDYA